MDRPTFDIKGGLGWMRMESMVRLHSTDSRLRASVKCAKKRSGQVHTDREETEEFVSRKIDERDERVA